jgi:hypothetical protein
VALLGQLNNFFKSTLNGRIEIYNFPSKKTPRTYLSNHGETVFVAIESKIDSGAQLSLERKKIKNKTWRN